jgi:galactose-1-phosphate uridylyltransferase
LELRRETLVSEILDPRHDFKRVAGSVEARWDPLTGHVARIVSGPRLLPASTFDLEAFARQTQPGCFFCTDRVENATPRWPPELLETGRITWGEAVGFPNIVTYHQYSAVAVYSPRRHFIPLERLTNGLIRDAVAVQIEFLRMVERHDPQAAWASINANHMLPSGSSLFHPHLQGAADPHPTTMQRLLSDVPLASFEEYLRLEAGGERDIGSSGPVRWLASFAPVGFNEVRGLIPGRVSPVELADDEIQALALGLANVLAAYADLGCQSFNLGIYGAPLSHRDYMLNLRLVARSNLEALYRSDATYSERIHWQALVDTVPEELSAAVRRRFSAAAGKD